MVINTNASAVDAAGSLQRSSAALSRSLARLSSGSKIIKPSDDAAGLSVSEKLEAQNTRINAAKVNTQNAMSLLQTADGFLENMSSVLDRMGELSVMASDVTKNSNDVALYSIEFESLKDQLRDVIGNGPNGTDSDPNWNMAGSEPAGTFNGISLFGERTSMSIVVGSSSDQTLKIDSINLREIGGAISNLLWDNSVDASQPDITVSSEGAIDTLKAALEQTAKERAGIGAEQSRLDVINTQLQVQSENLIAANSRIKDVDVAEESTRYARNNILVQSGTSMLQQANSMPETVLRLLN